MSVTDISEGLSRCARKLKRWNKYNFNHIKIRLRQCYHSLSDLQTTTPTETNIRLLHNVEKEIDCLLDKEEARWRQRSRLSWLRDGDRNTKYFHKHATSRFRRNYIGGITDSEGHWISDQKSITEQYFQTLFSSSSITIGSNLNFGLQGRATASMNLALCKPFSADEIKASLFQMHPSKAPGCDGIPAFFYQHYWSLVGDKLTAACLRVLNDGDDMKDINHTLIALVPEVQEPLQVSDFRPISLWTVMYEIISKSIVNRLKSFLPEIISAEQSAFVPEHQISDNVLLAFEHMHVISKRKSGFEGLMAIKFDMSKAYDRVEWVFLQWVMQELGFDHKSINLVMRCVSEVYYSLLISGKQCGLFRPNRGLSQGDPLSPYLFLICSEGLSSSLRQSVHATSLHGISVAPTAPTISHLFFADDTILFTKATPNECLHIMHILRVYEHASGQRINLQKTVITFSPNMSQSIRDFVTQSFQLQNTSGHQKYLGLPSLLGLRKQEAFEVLKHVWKRLDGWNSKLLSYAGKEVLIKAVAQAIPTYAMSCFKLPKRLVKDLTSLMNRFWWVSHGGKRGVPWLSWMQLTQPKAMGGLAFRSLEEFNKALLAKQCWRIVQCCTSSKG